MDLYVELMATQPEIEQQLKLIVEYRHMLRNINKKHMEKQIKVELQTKILKQHKDRLSRFVSQTFCSKEEHKGTLLLTDMYNGNTFEDKVPVEELLSSM